MKCKRFTLLLILLTTFLLAQNELGKSDLPFEWSGQWGISQTYGFSDWAGDWQIEGLTFDGNFSHWHQRYLIPFSESRDSSGTDSTTTSELWYRRGDYNLDEFAFQFRSHDSRKRSVNIKALKRNYDDWHGLLGPTTYFGAGGTIQQNYVLSFDLPVDSTEQWQTNIGYFKTSGMIPEEGSGDTSWVKGVSQRDEIIATSLVRSWERSKFKFQADLSTFGQRLKHKSFASDPKWGMDLTANWFNFFTEFKKNERLTLLAGVNTKYSAMSSDSLGNSSGLEVAGTVGIKKKIGLGELQIQGGAATIVQDTSTFIYDFNYIVPIGKTYLSISTNRVLSTMPNQMGVEQFSNIYGDANAGSQVQSITKVSVFRNSAKTKLTGEYFHSKTSPHYYFKESWIVEMPETINLIQVDQGSISGLTWNAQLNWFRNWWIGARGVSFSIMPNGWGNGIQHQGRVELGINELLFKKRMNATARIWFDYWSGRDNYVWKPALNLGYYDYNAVVFSQNRTAIFNAEFKAVISSFEITYTMLNFLYAGKLLIENYSGQTYTDEQLTLEATPFFPTPKRLAYFSIRWNFLD